MEEKIEIKALFSYIIHKWILLAIFAVVFAVVFNIYAYRKEVDKQAEAVELQTEYEMAAEELPGYYTKELFLTRRKLDDNTAAFCEACADVYQSFISDYQSGSLTTDTERFQAYMMFLNAYRDVLSVLSGDAWSYFCKLIAADMDVSTGVHPTVEPYIPSTVHIFQPRWAMIGLFIGVFFGSAIISIPFLFRKRNINIQ